MRPASLLLLLLAPCAARAGAREPLTLWHGYRGMEERALESAAADFSAKTGVRVELLAVPYDVFASKLIAAIGHGGGPDVFIYSHTRIASFERLGLLSEARGLREAEYLPHAVESVRVGGRAAGYPLSVKCLALFVNTRLAPRAPRTTAELSRLLGSLSRPRENRFGLAYETGHFYYHAPFLSGFGGRLFDESGRPAFDTGPMARSLAFVKGLQDSGFMPQESSGALVKSLFNEGRAAMAISGPWFAGEVSPGLGYAVAPLPVNSETGLRMSPLLEVEAAVVSSQSRQPEAAHALARFLSRDAAVVFARLGRQIPAFAAAYRDPSIAQDRYIAAFRRAAELSSPLPTSLDMSRIWEPMNLALRAVLRGGVRPREAGAFADRRYRALYREAPPRASPRPFAAALGAFLLIGLIAAVRAWRRCGGLERYPDLWRALAFMAPAAAGILVLVLVPFAFGLGLAFFHHDAGRYSFVGLANFKDILFFRNYRLTEPMSFYFTLAVTVLWTALNVALHVGIGLALALMLKSPLLRLKGVFRVALIIPWAVPNYITALVWKGMFHRQFGAVNGLLRALGASPVSWFSRFSTAFAANVAANTWLGFPFMMVVALGALQSIPNELYEAAEVDGASPWLQFRRITLPLLRPALMPSVVLGIVWTFNMFNIIYLVSGGEPGGSTDILVSEAYRWAFDRNEQYGFAAAYSALIFIILLAYSSCAQRLSRQGGRPA